MVARRTHELSDFLVNVLGVEDVGARFDGRVTYHMACHLRGLGVLEEPLRLLRYFPSPFRSIIAIMPVTTASTMSSGASRPRCRTRSVVIR